MPDTENSDFVHNFYTKYDLMCMSQEERTPSRYFFFGFGFGILLFFFPDVFGRKNGMLILMPFFIMGYTLVQYGGDMETKGLGYLMLGITHMRITISFQHVIDLIPGEYKAISTTVINLVD